MGDPKISGKGRRALIGRSKGDEGGAGGYLFGKDIDGGEGQRDGEIFWDQRVGSEWCDQEIRGRLAKESQLRERIEFLKQKSYRNFEGLTPNLRFPFNSSKFMWSFYPFMVQGITS